MNGIILHTFFDLFYSVTFSEIHPADTFSCSCSSFFSLLNVNPVCHYTAIHLYIELMLNILVVAGFGSIVSLSLLWILL